MGADFLWHSLLSYDFCAGEGELSFVCVVIFAVDLSGFFASSLSQLFQPKVYEIHSVMAEICKLHCARSLHTVLSQHGSYHTFTYISSSFPVFSHF